MVLFYAYHAYQEAKMKIYASYCNTFDLNVVIFAALLKVAIKIALVGERSGFFFSGLGIMSGNFLNFSRKFELVFRKLSEIEKNNNTRLKPNKGLILISVRALSEKCQ